MEETCKQMTMHQKQLGYVKSLPLFFFFLLLLVLFQATELDMHNQE